MGWLDWFRPRPRPTPPPAPPPPAPRYARVSVFQPEGGFATGLSGTLAFEDPTWPPVVGEVENGRLRFALDPPATPYPAQYGWYAWLAVRDGDGRTFGERRLVQPDTDILLPPKRATAGLPGVATLVGKAWVVGGRPCYPWTWSLLWCLGAFMKGGAEKARAGRNAAFIRAHGGDAVRWLYEVDWSAQPYGGLIRGTESAAAECLDWLWRDYGLKSKISAQAGAPSPRVRQIGEELVRAASVAPAESLLLFEGTNEQYASRADAITLARILAMSGRPTAVGWGTAEPAEVEALTAEAGVSVCVKHRERTLSDPRQTNSGSPFARQDRQCWDFHDFRHAADDGEGPGPGSSVASTDDPFHLAFQRVGAIAMGAGSTCLHTGSMVYGVGYMGPTGQRYANVDEIPRIAEIAAACRNADAVIGFTGVENWAKTNNPIPVEVVGGKVDKQYYAISPVGDVLGVLTDTAGPLAFRENQPMASFSLHHPVTGEVVAPDSGLAGYVVKGRLA